MGTGRAAGPKPYSDEVGEQGLGSSTADSRHMIPTAASKAPALAVPCQPELLESTATELLWLLPELAISLLANKYGAAGISPSNLLMGTGDRQWEAPLLFTICGSPVPLA